MNIKWGILGAGKIAKKFAKDFRAVNNGKIVAIASRSEKRSAGFAKEFNIAKSYSSYEEMLTDNEIDVIYIATPHNFHFEHTKLCFTHGKAVLCEKPVSINSSEFEILTKLAKEKNLFFMEALWTYYLPAIQKSMEWIKEGKIGEIKQIQVSFGFIGNMEAKGRLANPKLAGGALLDIGIYGIAISELLLNDKVKQLQALAHFSEQGIDEYNCIQIEYQNGAMAQISSSFVSNLKNEAIVYGTKGRIEIPRFWMAKEALLVNADEELKFTDNTPELGYNHEAFAVNELIKNGKIESPIVSLEKSKRIVSLLDEVRRQIGLKYPFES